MRLKGGLIQELTAIALVVIGVMVLCLGFCLGWTDSNLCLFFAFFSIVVGAILYIVRLKKKTDY